MKLINADTIPYEEHYVPDGDTQWEYRKALCVLKDTIDQMPEVDAVSRGLFEQYKWERDIAIGQLEELGLSLGQKIEGVYLTKDEHEKLLEYKYMYEDLCK
jgi:hypothetical protein